MGICSFASLPGHIQVDFQRALLDFGVLSCIYQNVLKLENQIVLNFDIILKQWIIKLGLLKHSFNIF